MTQIINLYGGPGTGKSTSAALIYHHLKRNGYNSELVREYAKDWAWDNRSISAYDQLYVLGKQVRRESSLYGKVDFVVTDSPLIMAYAYAKEYYGKHIADSVKATISAFYEQSRLDKHTHKHIFLKRSKAYEASGRYQTEEQALAIDHAVREFLGELGVPYVESSTSEEELLGNAIPGVPVKTPIPDQILGIPVKFKASFLCPKCGSRSWGTSAVTSDSPVGHCHGDGCHFSWPRSKDHEVMQIFLKTYEANKDVWELDYKKSLYDAVFAKTHEEVVPVYQVSSSRSETKEGG